VYDRFCVWFFYWVYNTTRSRDSSVGMTRYGLEGPGIESRWSEIFHTHPDRLWGPPSLLYNEYRVFPGGKGSRVVMLTTHPLLVPRLRKSWAIPPLTLWVLLGLLRGSLYLITQRDIFWWYKDTRIISATFCTTCTPAKNKQTNTQTTTTTTVSQWSMFYVVTIWEKSMIKVSKQHSVF
jgi:hypothetical protein